MTKRPTPDPKLDLVLDRLIDVPKDLLWKAWTTPEHLREWFVPKPWTISDCEIDLKPGGIFKTVMRSPEGQDFPYTGCYLEVEPGERLVWTSALQPAYRPSPHSDGPIFTVYLTMEPEGDGTRYVATVLHPDEESRSKHEAMGFYQGWGTVLDQLVAHVKAMLPADS